MKSTSSSIDVPWYSNGSGLVGNGWVGDGTSPSRAVSVGTGRSSIHSKRGVAGKTGTSDDYRDSWFAGYDGDLLSVVWVGRDDNSPHGLTGSVGAMRVWDAFASTVPVTPSVSPFVGTDYSWIDVDYASGTSARASCADVVSLPIPTSVSLPRKPGCGDTLKRLGDRVRSWFKDS